MPLLVADLEEWMYSDEEEYDLLLQIRNNIEEEDDADRVKRRATASKHRVKRRATSTDEDDEDDFIDYMPRKRHRLPMPQRNDYTEALEDLEDIQQCIQARDAARSRKKMYDEETTDFEYDEEKVNRTVDNKKKGHPDSRGTITQYVPENSSRTYEAPTQGAGWANTSSGNHIEAGTPRDSSPAYANVPSP